MSLTSESMTPADIAAVTGNNGFGGFGGDGGAWWIIILFLFAFVGWGNGGRGYGGYGSGVSDGYVLSSDFSMTERKLDSISNGLCDGFYSQAQLNANTNMAMANGFAQAELARTNGNTAIMQSINGIGTQIQQCCCDARYDNLVNSNAVQNSIQTGFCQTNFNNSNNTRDIIDSQNSGTRAILEKLSAMESNAKDEKIAEQAQKINALQLAASQSAQNAYLVNTLTNNINPRPIPAYQVANPNVFCGCNC